MMVSRVVAWDGVRGYPSRMNEAAGSSEAAGASGMRESRDGERYEDDEESLKWSSAESVVASADRFITLGRPLWESQPRVWSSLEMRRSMRSSATKPPDLRMLSTLIPGGFHIVINPSVAFTIQ